MSYSLDWYESAVAITCGFESDGDPYLAVEGDFDKMGISCGALQWNIGQASLQPMVKSVGKAVIVAAMPVHSDAMWSAVNTTVSKGLAIVREWQKVDSKGVPRLLPKPKAELRALMGTVEMRAQQDRYIRVKADRAWMLASNWANGRDDSQPSKRLFCWMFDVATQNGSLEGQTPDKASSFITLNKPDKVDDLVCDYLASFKGTSGHVKDAHGNATLWRDKAAGEKLELLCLSYLRAHTAAAKWRHVVINRKGSIAMGGGYVNGGKLDFSAHGL